MVDGEIKIMNIRDVKRLVGCETVREDRGSGDWSL